ncbi:MAG: hypothetical protein LBI84_01195 [Propionibacteriaceae bacterium]|jgi:hypothetical protein|nr:hypothetical protein [Propionibacteriaceae bacterium]
MVRVFLRDLLRPRRLLGNLVFCVAAALAGAMMSAPVAPAVYLAGAAAAAALAWWLLMAGYWKADRLIDAAQLPAPRGRFLLAFTVAAAATLLADTTAPIIAFGLASGTMRWELALICVVLAYAVAAAGLAAYLAVREKSWKAVPVVLAALLACAGLVWRGGGLGAAAAAVGLSVGGCLWLRRSRHYYLPRPGARLPRLRTDNYFITVALSQPVTVINAAILLGFAAVFTVMISQSGIPAPFGLAIVAVSSPLATMMSVDPDLRQHWRMLGRPAALAAQYRVCCLVWFAFANSALFAVYAVLGWPRLLWVAVLAVAATAVETIAIPWLEVRFPITGQATPKDVWRHPRKYILPGAILLLTMPMILTAS